MDRIEEDRVTELWYQALNANKETPTDIPYDFARLIQDEVCQLFEKDKPKLDCIVCPFCGENGFDKMGLKYHLRNYCKEYQNTEDIPL